ncbi:MAG: polysaccharide biosynthesis/export family protein [Candidatus Margulisbacteria bacterium]|nr:polysaccharide biosynthesis/export family protein [Candidatus Margulisiibacteriota bacterium]MBU1022526.1 polysaccharide biosynthesis/export family protein [Candidatus Margulisiibacteriota bacterium]MBU1728398.1 polysaccharide biosynthesis/export family protein [Candidatus Margulisiibacteriota bacterium]MBU1955242.1 polysaccharide biosynthesis/export family protein [Candidatus Margulisiibacteriota bacterium]
MKKSICILLIMSFLLGLNLSSIGFAADYTLAPDDILEVKIINRKDLNTKQTIAPDGSISLPLIGRTIAGGKTLDELNSSLVTEFKKYIQNPQVVVFLDPRPIYIVQHDVRKNTWDVKEASSIEEARALAGKDYTGTIAYGETITVEVNKKPDWWEDNWYKVLTGVAVVAGVYATLNR